jgi:hypothetical protein
VTNPLRKIVKMTGYAARDWKCGHIAVTDDGRAYLVSPFDADAAKPIEFKDEQNETAEARAARHVRENIDEEAHFFDDTASLHLVIWLSEN